MKELKQKIMEILAVFKQEELGNRLSQFSINGLIIAIDNVFEEEMKKDKENKKEEKINGKNVQKNK